MSRSTASIQMFPIPLKAAAARRDDSCGLPMQRSCSACSLSLSSISARPSSFSAVPARGHVFAPIAGIVSTGLAHVGQSLVAGTPIAEILDPTDIFVDWYIPNVRLIDPTVGKEVSVVFGNRRIPGKISQILPVSGVYAGTQQLLTRDRPATQIARIRFDPGTSPPPLNSTVDVRMHYTYLSARVANVLVRLFEF